MQSAGPIILVTGGSRGIGRATALMAAARGYAVAISFVSNEVAAQAVVAQITAGGGRAMAVRADVSIEADIQALFARVDEKLGPLTALVNNAGVIGQISRLDAMTMERLTRVFQTNITGAFLCAKEAVRRMSTKYGGTGGAIVNMSSIAARIGSANEFIDYAASKSALDAMTLGLSKEVAAEGIRVNAVRPGLIDTDIHASAGAPDRLQKFLPFVPNGRIGTPDEVAAVTLWLLSDEASYVTGALVDVGGGR